MDNIILALVLTVNVALLIIVLVAISRVKRVFNEVKAFITPETKGEPSPLAITVDNISSVFARSFVAQFKTTLMGVESGIKRQEKAVAGDVALDVARSAGGLAGLLTQFPSVSKHIRRNPGLVDAALQMLSSRGQQQPAENNHHSSSQDVMSIK